MILFGAAGWAAQTWLHFQPGVAIGVIVGFVVAPALPGPRACGVRPPPREDPSS